MITHYITATTTLFLEGKDADNVLENLRKVMKKRGHESLYGKVLKGVLRALAAHEKSTDATVTVANQDAYASQKDAIESALAALQYSGDKKDIAIEINPHITGGYIATYNNKQIDYSYRQKLVDLYRSIIKQ